MYIKVITIKFKPETTMIENESNTDTFIKVYEHICLNMHKFLFQNFMNKTSSNFPNNDKFNSESINKYLEFIDKNLKYHISKDSDYIYINLYEKNIIIFIESSSLNIIWINNNSSEDTFPEFNKDGLIDFFNNINPIIINDIIYKINYSFIII